LDKMEKFFRAGAFTHALSPRISGTRPDPREIPTLVEKGPSRILTGGGGQPHLSLVNVITLYNDNVVNNQCV